MSLVDWLTARLGCLLRGHQLYTTRWRGCRSVHNECGRCGATWWEVKR